MNCGICDKALSKRNVSGYCRAHSATGLHQDPDRKAQKYARRSLTMSEPRRRNQLLARLSAISAGKVNNWCPEPYRAEYRDLTRNKGFRAAEAKVMILETARRAERQRLGAMTPHERAMDRVANGAALIIKPDLRKAAHAFTLGGVASGELA